MEALRQLAIGDEFNGVVEQPLQSALIRPPGAYSGVELLSFYQLNKSQACPDFSERLQAAEEMSALRDLGNLIYAHSREPRCASQSGYEDKIDQHIARRFSHLDLQIHDLFNVELEAVLPDSLPKLNAPYGFKGGAARLALRSTLELRARDCPRDLDLIRFGEGDETTDKCMSREYMPADFAISERNGVEIIQGMRSYLRTRDLALNEVLLLGDRLHLTVQCLLDTLSDVIRPTAAHYTNNRTGMRSGVAAKALRFFAESAANGADGQMVYFGVDRNLNLRPFDIALNLRRAAQQSSVEARLYLAAIELTGSYPGVPWRSPAPEVLAYLSRREELPRDLLEGVSF